MLVPKCRTNGKIGSLINFDDQPIIRGNSQLLKTLEVKEFAAIEEEMYNTN